MPANIGPYRILGKAGDPRLETISVALGDAEVTEAHARASTLRDQQDALKQERAGAMQEFKARGQRLADAEATARRQAATRRKDVEIALQDYITGSNEVITVRTDTQEVMGRRTATAEELETLQTEMFGSDDEEDDGFGKPS